MNESQVKLERVPTERNRAIERCWNYTDLIYPQHIEHIKCTNRSFVPSLARPGLLVNW